MSQDKLVNFPNQIIDNDPTECVALTVADICGNIDNQLYDPDLIYANALKIENETPSTLGLDPLAGMQAAIVYGCLPMTLDTFSAKTMGQLYIANWQNYPLFQRQEAQKHTRNGIKPLKSYQDISSHLNKNIGGVSLAMKWFESFNNPGPDGVLPAPTGPFSYHNVAVYDNPLKGLQIKPWLGDTYGLYGYGYMNQSVFNQVFIQANAFDPNAWRWLSLATISVTHPWTIPDVLPLLK